MTFTGTVSSINDFRLAHTGDTLISLGNAGVETRTFPVTPGRTYTARVWTRQAARMDFYSTGVDDSRSLVAPRVQDFHYFVIPGVPVGRFPTFVLDPSEPPFSPPESWSPNSLFSQWIAPYPVVPATNGTGRFIFRTYVSLYEQDPATFNLRRPFRWSGDDNGEYIRVNGRPPYMQPGNASTNFGAGLPILLPNLSPGLNVIDFYVNDVNGAEGLRVEVEPTSYVTSPFVQSASPRASISIGGITRQIQPTGVWSVTEVTFGATSSTETLVLRSEVGEVWVDTVSVESSGDVFLHPEEPFELLEGERAMGEWRLEVRDTRTGAVLPTSEVLEWSLEIAFADTANPALYMRPGDTQGPITLVDDQVQWVVLDPCQAATFVRLRLIGLDNTNLVLFANQTGFPTGDPELDTYKPIRNLQLEGPNGVATFEISPLLPAPARLTGKPIYIGIINEFLGQVNDFRLEFDSDGDCAISGPPPELNPNTPVVGTLEPDPNGGTSTNGPGIFQFTVPANARAATVTVTSDGDVTLYGQKDTVPTISTFTYRAEGVPGAGTETMRIDQTAVPPLTPGLYFVRIVNNTTAAVSYTATVTFEFDSGPAPILLSVILTSVGGVQLNYTAEVGETYIIEATDDLGPSGTWVVLETQVATSTLQSYNVPFDIAQNYQFFRVRKP
jgi:hypothetical protein